MTEANRSGGPLPLGESRHRHGSDPSPAVDGQLLPGLSLDAVERLRVRSALAHHRATMRDARIRAMRESTS
jgi:hypothetical protein